MLFYKLHSNVLLKISRYTILPTDRCLCVCVLYLYNIYGQNTPIPNQIQLISINECYRFVRHRKIIFRLLRD